jgi:hypothetical protein
MAKAAANSDALPMRPRTTALLVVAVVAAALSGSVLHPVLAVPVAGLALVALVYGRRGALVIPAALVAGWLTGLSTYIAYPAIVVPLVGVPLTARTPYVYGALTVLSLLVAGPVTAGLMRRRPALETAAVVTVALSVLQVGALALLADGAGMSLQGYVSEAIAGMIALGGGLADAQAAVAALWPSVAVALNGFSAVLLTAGVGVIAAGRGIPAFRFPAVATIDLDPLLVVPGIAGIGLLAAGRLPVGFAPVLDVIGQNMLVVVRWVFFLQGVAVFAALYERAKIGRPARSLGYVVLGVTEMLLPLVSLTGFADVWLNLRRLPREKHQDEAVEAPSDTD